MKSSGHKMRFVGFYEHVPNREIGYEVVKNILKKSSGHKMRFVGFYEHVPNREIGYVVVLKNRFCGILKITPPIGRI